MGVIPYRKVEGFLALEFAEPENGTTILNALKEASRKSELNYSERVIKKLGYNNWSHGGEELYFLSFWNEHLKNESISPFMSEAFRTGEIYEVKLATSGLNLRGWKTFVNKNVPSNSILFKPYLSRWFTDVLYKPSFEMESMKALCSDLKENLNVKEIYNLRPETQWVNRPA